MFLFVAGAVAILTVLLIAELLWRRKHVRSEVARKFVHLSVGCFIATWPLVISLDTIVWISAALLVIVAVSKYLHVFKSIHSVNRSTVGELLFPIGIASSAYFAESRGVFIAAVLHMSVADGLAAMIGHKYGRAHRYRILGQYKSVLGTMVFWLSSTIITGGILWQANQLQSDSLLILGLVPSLTAAAENLGVYGVDNILVPGIVVVLMNAAF